MKTETKKELKQMSVKELQEVLIEFEKEKMKLENIMYSKNGTSMTVRNYPTVLKEWEGQGNLKEIKKNIARVKTWLNVKLKNTKR